MPLAGLAFLPLNQIPVSTKQGAFPAQALNSFPPTHHIESNLYSNFLYNFFNDLDESTLPPPFHCSHNIENNGFGVIQPLAFGKNNKLVITQIMKMEMVIQN